VRPEVLRHTPGQPAAALPWARCATTALTHGERDRRGADRRVELVRFGATRPVIGRVRIDAGRTPRPGGRQQDLGQDRRAPRTSAMWSLVEPILPGRD
jgi:hypothetical protein